MKQTIDVQTKRRTEMIDITARVQESLRGASDGTCVVYTPHTTSAITINEGADPDVCRDIDAALTRLFPREGDYRHAEGNSDAHLKSVIVGSSQTLLVEGGRLLLGRWQSIFFCEFDGPRARKVHVRFIAG